MDAGWFAAGTGGFSELDEDLELRSLRRQVAQPDLDIARAARDRDITEECGDDLGQWVVRSGVGGRNAFERVAPVLVGIQDAAANLVDQWSGGRCCGAVSPASRSLQYRAWTGSSPWSPNHRA